jgi:LmbE family N-acetylglucosaminyl deacetylase
LLAAAALVALGAAALAPAAPAKRQPPNADLLRPHLTLAPPHHADVVVFAPHPDDEVLATGGVILQARASGKSVAVVYMTSGDGYPDAAAMLRLKTVYALTARDFLMLGRTRQQEALKASGLLGVPRANAIFLGYPDAALDQVAANREALAVAQEFTDQSATYGSWVRDFHSTLHGKAAPYTHDAVVGDVVELMRRLGPRTVYAPMLQDGHPDHAATFTIVNEALYRVGFRGRFATHLIHGAIQASWPWPRGTDLTGRYLLEPGALPEGVAWPPPLRVRLTPGQARRKQQALGAELTQLALPGEAEGLNAFVKGEEVFWPLRW